MAKWADFGVFRVKYDREHAAIVEVDVRADLGDNFGDSKKATRAEVIAAIGQGHTFVTVYSRDGKATKGEDVRVVMIGAQKYIKTDSNGSKADNLGTLPEYT
jgi:hypothetical protein